MRLRTALLGLTPLLVPAAFAQQVAIVSGRVTDARTGEGIIGANVSLTGTTFGAAADLDGNYRVALPAGTYTVLVTAVGYSRFTQPLTLTAGQTLTLNVRMTEDAVGLDELVVTGYGAEQERRNLSTSIVSVRGEDIRDLPPMSADAALQGRAAGVTVLQSSGTPGGGVSVRVRGATSVSGSNQPLYVVDGVPISSGSFSQLGAGNQGTNALATIDPADIADMQILKDAAATALYGTRASNGVVLITTRRGLQGRTQVEFEASTGTSSLSQNPSLLTGNQYVALRRQAIRNQTNPGTAPNYGAFTDTTSQTTTNYWDEVTRTGSVQNYRLGLAGGSGGTRYRVSGAYSDEAGAVIRSGFERYNGSVNVEHRWNQRGTIFAKASYNRGTSRRVGNDNYIYGVLTNALLGRPDQKPFLADGTTYNPASGPFSNPLAEAQTRFTATDTKFLGNLDLTYEILPGLSLRGSAGLDRFDLRDDRYAQSFTSQGSPNGSGANANTFFQNVIVSANAIYRPSMLGEQHSLQLLAGISQEDTRTETATATGINYPLDQTSLINAAATTTGGQTATRSGLRSYLGSADYAFMGRYLATASVRVDGSSRFGENKRYGVFPAGSLGWNVKEERFMQGFNSIDLLKLRASYGITGQQEIGNFTRLTLFNTGGSYAGNPALSPAQLGNPDLQWEETRQFSAGLDFVLLAGRIGGTVEYYNKQTSDLLLNALLPLTSGYGGVQRNIGDIENKGLEFQLNTINLSVGGFKWTSTFNIATNENKVLKLYDGNGDGIGDPQNSGFASRLEEGRPLGSFYGYVSEGLFTSASQICPFVAGESVAARGARCLAAGQAYHNATAVNTGTGTVNPSGTFVGDRRFRDINGRDAAGNLTGNPDGLINADDQTYIGDPNPDFFGGLSNTFSFKGFELSAFLQFSSGNDVYNATIPFYERSYRTSGTLLNAYSPTNTNTETPRVTTSDPNGNYRVSSALVEDGSYLRLKTLTFAYTVPGRYVRVAGAQGLRLYAVGENLWTTTRYSGLDPEVSTFDRSNTSFGTDFFTYPQARRFTLGARLTF